MRPSWYETALPHRTVCLCDECYTPDPLAGRRPLAEWERNEAIWGEVPVDYYDESWVWQNAYDNAIRAYEEAA